MYTATFSDRVILLLSGWMGSGKDTLGKFLKDLAPQDVEIHQYSTALKEMAAFLLDVPTEKFADYEFKQKHRLFLQRLGTDVIRKQLNENFWVDKMIEKICRSRAKIIVITDVRFPNEIDYLRLQIGINWRILPVRVFRETTRSLHESETALDNYKKWWRQVSNNQTFEHLRWEAEDILRSL